MKTFFLSSLVAGLRSRSFQLILLLGLLLVGVAFLAAMFSPRQPQTVALDVGLSGLRFTLVLLALFWVQELFGREIDRRTVALALAYPVPRSHYVLGRFAGIAALLALAILIMALLLWGAVLFADRGYQALRPVALGLPYWATVAAVYLDVLVVAAFALCLSALSTVSMLPVALSAIFAIVAKGLGAVVDFLLVRQGDGDAQMLAQFGPVIRVLHWLLPDLSRLDWRDWTLYQLPPSGGSLIFSMVMGIAYMTVLLIIGVKVFERREFA